jgi:hypothetical protein
MFLIFSDLIKNKNKRHVEVLEMCFLWLKLNRGSWVDLTKTLCEQISTIVCRWWWAQNEEENKVHEKYYRRQRGRED